MNEFNVVIVTSNRACALLIRGNKNIEFVLKVALITGLDIV